MKHRLRPLKKRLNKNQMQVRREKIMRRKHGPFVILADGRRVWL